MTSRRGYALTILATRRTTERRLPAGWWVVVASCPHGISTQSIAAGSAEGLHARRAGLIAYHRVRQPPLDGLRMPCRCPLTAFLANDEGPDA